MANYLIKFAALKMNIMAEEKDTNSKKSKKFKSRDNHLEEGKKQLGENNKQFEEITKQLDEARQQLDETRQQLDESKDQYVRLAAEFDNFRRRSAKERLELISSAGKDVLTGFLPVLDDCQRALDVLKKSEAQKEAIEGTELILNKLTSFLNQRGISKIEAIGQDFNTDFHEAVAQIPAQDENQKNKVIDIVQEGYTLNGTVVRYAKVVVGV